MKTLPWCVGSVAGLDVNQTVVAHGGDGRYVIVQALAAAGDKGSTLVDRWCTRLFVNDVPTQTWAIHKTASSAFRWAESKKFAANRLQVA